MRDLPKIFPLGLLALLVFVVFLGAYALADSALTAVPSAEAAVSGGPGGGGPEGDHEAFAWYEDTAIFICPLH